MSDFEMAYMFNDYLNLLFTVFMGHVSIVFAFLVAAFLVADRMSKSMVTVVIILFTIGVGVTTTIQNRFGGAMIAMGQEMRQAVADGRSNLGWHSITYEPTIIIEGFMISLTVLMILSYAGALVFFFLQRSKRHL